MLVDCGCLTNLPVPLSFIDRSQCVKVLCLRLSCLMVLSLYLKGWQFDSLAVAINLGVPQLVLIVPQNRCGLTMKVGTQYLLHISGNHISSALLKIQDRTKNPR